MKPLAIILFLLITLSGCVSEKPLGCPDGVEVQVVEVAAEKYSFTPDPITVTAGKCIEFVLTSLDVSHWFAVPELGINESMEPGQVTRLKFYAPPEKRGSYTLYCSVYCGSGHDAMRGTFIIE